MPEQFLHKGLLADFGKNFDLMQSKSVCSRGVLVFFASGATARKALRQWIAEELGAFRNLVDVFMKGCRGEVEDAVGSSLAPFDIDNWPRTGSPETLPCPQHLRPACGPILVTVTVPFSVMRRQATNIQATGKSAWPPSLCLSQVLASTIFTTLLPMAPQAKDIAQEYLIARPTAEHARRRPECVTCCGMTLMLFGSKLPSTGARSWTS